MASEPEQVATVRRFNRAWTEVTALLDDGYLESGLGLPEARLIYELAARSPQSIVELRNQLRLDPGYTTRLLDRLAERGLVTREPDPADRRRQMVALTLSGVGLAAELSDRADAKVYALLAPLRGADRGALVDALDTVSELMGAPADPAEIRPAAPHELGWVLGRHIAVYAEEYGWPGFAAAVARLIAAALDAGDPFWVAERNGRLLGCVACYFDDAETARLRLLLVEPAARGQRLGARLIDQVVQYAREGGYRQLVLHTQDALTAARKLYAAAGFRLDRVDPESYDPSGVGEHWVLDLR